MKDETYVFIHDVKEKCSAARSARNRRTHTGKGGRVRLPSDNLTKKELEAMNGEMKSYKLNSPITWEEFKAMPDDIKKIYLLGIHNKWNVPYSEIAKMMGSYQQKLAKVTKQLGITSSNHSWTKWDKEGFYAWVNGITLPAAEEEIPAEESPVEEIAVEEVPVVEEIPVEEIAEEADDEVVTLPFDFTPISEQIHKEEKVIPYSGRMQFKGNAKSILESVVSILGDANVNIEISWVVE